MAVGSGSRGRLGSLSMGSARFFFKRGVSPLYVGATCGFAFEEYWECEIQGWCVIPCNIPVCQQFRIVGGARLLCRSQLWLTNFCPLGKVGISTELWERLSHSYYKKRSQISTRNLKGNKQTKKKKKAPSVSLSYFCLACPLKVAYMPTSKLVYREFNWCLIYYLLMGQKVITIHSMASNRHM